MQIAKSYVSLKAKNKILQQQNAKTAFVPTMGALHEGHFALIKQAKTIADKVIVSIFVNPLQFNQQADFAEYPIMIEEDVKALQDIGVDLAYLPTIEDIYPAGFDTYVKPGKIVNCLCGTSRGSHMQGVATILLKLFNRLQPDMALFGEKDYQQFLLTKKMADDFDLPIKVIPIATEREKTGLAMSSRNKNLSQNAKEKIAPLIYQKLLQVAQSDIALDIAIKQANEQLIIQGFSKIDYFELRDQENLQLLNNRVANSRLFIAAWLEGVRLIDNIAIMAD